MGFRFYRRVHLCPGLSVNLSRSGPSLTMGVRGAHITVGSRGVTKTVGLPGTGLFDTSRQSLHTGYHSAASDRPLTAEEHGVAARQAERVMIGVVLLIVALVTAVSMIR
jgi:Protein of unknown function (DUF4236)